jgi:hypothetical protein
VERMEKYKYIGIAIVGMEMAWKGWKREALS